MDSTKTQKLTADLSQESYWLGIFAINGLNRKSWRSHCTATQAFENGSIIKMA